ncbi:hypothetical protein VP01_468g4 [Puccinia sorghi]|uniref:Uncharacterized protein n=1 Tax=Puccinia sorghi TaxID=27349 RepID=A0A0L6UQ29_9BASI|nr:hypothetical protein VP01_468g4 [Puccinia sorghi]
MSERVEYPYCTTDEAGEVALRADAWVTSTSEPIYKLTPESFRDNTEYAKRISAANREAMYGSRNLTVVYPDGSKCPYLPVAKVRILGVQAKPGAVQAYGTNYVRVGIEEKVYNDLCSRVGQVLKLKDPPIEKVAAQAGLRVFTVTMPRTAKVQSLAEAEDPEDPSGSPSETMVTIPDPSAVFTLGLDVLASCYFIVKAKYKGPVASPDNIQSYSISLEPMCITLIDSCDKTLESEVAVSAPGVSDASATPPDARVTENLKPGCDGTYTMHIFTDGSSKLHDNDIGAGDLRSSHKQRGRVAGTDGCYTVGNRELALAVERRRDRDNILY